MVERKKSNRYRHWIQAAWFALTNGYAVGFLEKKIYRGKSKMICVPGLNCYSCPGALSACPIGALQSVIDSSKFQFSCYIFGFLMLFGSIFGRFICGWLCPFGLFQDLIYKIPLMNKKKNMPGHRYLKYLKYVILVVFVIVLPITVVGITGMGQPWFCKYICPSGTLMGGIPLIILDSTLRSAVGFLFTWKVFLLIVTIVLSMKYYRPFCKYICPLGAIYGIFNPIALYRFRVDENQCIGCKACQKACGMDIPVWEKPNSAECIRCGDCKAVCPTGAISTSIGLCRKEHPPH
ncbi:MAG: 4Fe-4S binding protein [Clostridium sp.]